MTATNPCSFDLYWPVVSTGDKITVLSATSGVVLHYYDTPIGADHMLYPLDVGSSYEFKDMECGLFWWQSSSESVSSSDYINVRITRDSVRKVKLF